MSGRHAGSLSTSELHASASQSLYAHCLSPSMCVYLQADKFHNLQDISCCPLHVPYMCARCQNFPDKQACLFNKCPYHKQEMHSTICCVEASTPCLRLCTPLWYVALLQSAVEGLDVLVHGLGSGQPSPPGQHTGNPLGLQLVLRKRDHLPRQAHKGNRRRMVWWEDVLVQVLYSAAHQVTVSIGSISWADFRKRIYLLAADGMSGGGLWTRQPSCGQLVLHVHAIGLVHCTAFTCEAGCEENCFTSRQCRSCLELACTAEDLACCR